MDAAALENELYSTVSDKQVFLVRLRQLRAEVRLVEASLELTLMERTGLRWLPLGIAVLVAVPVLLYPRGIVDRHRGANVKEAEHTAIPETTWPSSEVIPSTSSTATSAPSSTSAAARCFVRIAHPCSNGEGLGGLFRRMEWVIAIAERYHCAYVCNEADWPTGGHGTGNVGHLFGCSQHVIGDGSRMVAAAAVEGLTRAPVILKYNGSRHYVIRYKKGQPLLRSSAWYVDLPQGAQVWELSFKCRDDFYTVTHETTWRWIQQQFHAARVSQGRSATAWGNDGESSPRLRIALQLRRGDRPAACPLYLYLNALRDLSIALPWMSVEKTKILLIGPLDRKSEEFTCMKRLEAEFLVVKKKPRADMASVALQLWLGDVWRSDASLKLISSSHLGTILPVGLAPSNRSATALLGLRGFAMLCHHGGRLVSHCSGVGRERMFALLWLNLRADPEERPRTEHCEKSTHSFQAAQSGSAGCCLVRWICQPTSGSCYHPSHRSRRSFHRSCKGELPGKGGRGIMILAMAHGMQLKIRETQGSEFRWESSALMRSDVPHTQEDQKDYHLKASECSDGIGSERRGMERDWVGPTCLELLLFPNFQNGL
eukprot:s531_g6.t3